MVQEMPEARKSCSPFYCLWARDVYVCVCVCMCVYGSMGTHKRCATLQYKADYFPFY